MNPKAPFVALTLSLAIACSREPAPAPATNQSAHDAHGAAAPAARTALIGNLGAYHRAIKTDNAEAQQFFDEGLTLLYGFNHEESFRSFELAASRDAASPMPHWGMSLALGTNINDTAPADRLKQGYAHLAEAQKRRAAGSEVEQGLVDALARRYVADAAGDQAVREQAYSSAMGELARRFPADLADLASLKAAAARIPGDAMVGASNTAAAVVAVAVADLTARIADAKGDTAGAISGFTAAVAAEDKLGYNEPPDWLNPERERLGAVLLKAGRFADAERVFRADLTKNTGNPRSLYGLFRAIDGQKKASAAAKASFDTAWSGADVSLGDDLYGTRR